RQQDEIRVTVIATGLKDARGGGLPAQRRPQAPDTGSREPASEPRSRLAPESVSQPRERPILPASREPEFERPRRPSATEWERERPRTPPPADAGDDDWDVPAFM